jgi:hypothetical protein
MNRDFGYEAAALFLLIGEIIVGLGIQFAENGTVPYTIILVIWIIVADVVSIFATPKFSWYIIVVTQLLFVVASIVILLLNPIVCEKTELSGNGTLSSENSTECKDDRAGLAATFNTGTVIGIFSSCAAVSFAILTCSGFLSSVKVHTQFKIILGIETVSHIGVGIGSIILAAAVVQENANWFAATSLPMIAIWGRIVAMLCLLVGFKKLYMYSCYLIGPLAGGIMSFVLMGIENDSVKGKDGEFVSPSTDDAGKAGFAVMGISYILAFTFMTALMVLKRSSESSEAGDSENDGSVYPCGKKK